jgi:4-carboxymuconolactone decarboxylase
MWHNLIRHPAQVPETQRPERRFDQHDAHQRTFPLSVEGRGCQLHETTHKETIMYLPDIFQFFLEKHPDIAAAFNKVGDLAVQSGPLDPKTRHLVQLGIAIGTGSKGGVRSHARRALEKGAVEEELVQAVLLSATAVGFPAMIAAYGWVAEVLDARIKSESV